MSKILGLKKIIGEFILVICGNDVLKLKMCRVNTHMLGVNDAKSLR